MITTQDSITLQVSVDIVHRVGDQCTVMSGEDLMMGGYVLFGAEAVIIASANLIPGPWVKYFEDAKAKDVEVVIQFQKTYYPLFDLLFAEINPAPLKYAMGRIGMDAGTVSTPLQSCSVDLQSKLDDMLKQFGLL